jgi:hypothetical protein
VDVVFAGEAGFVDNGTAEGVGQAECEFFDGHSAGIDLPTAGPGAASGGFVQRRLLQPRSALCDHQRIDRLFPRLIMNFQLEAIGEKCLKHERTLFRLLLTRRSLQLCEGVRVHSGFNVKML